LARTSLLGIDFLGDSAADGSSDGSDHQRDGTVMGLYGTVSGLGIVSQDVVCVHKRSWVDAVARFGGSCCKSSQPKPNKQCTEPEKSCRQTGEERS
jgi:hypothetical protein